MTLNFNASRVVKSDRRGGTCPQIKHNFPQNYRCDQFTKLFVLFFSLYWFVVEQIDLNRLLTTLLQSPFDLISRKSFATDLGVLISARRSDEELNIYPKQCNIKLKLKPFKNRTF